MTDVTSEWAPATYSAANVTDPPTDAEIVAAFGAAATVGAGFVGIINDAGGDVSGDVWVCYSTGVAWHYAATVKAV